MISEVANFVATLGRIHTWFPAPTLLAILLGAAWFFLISRWLSRKRWLVAWFIAQIVVAILVIRSVDPAFTAEDPSAIILDEFVALPLVFLSTNLTRSVRSLITLLLGLGLFGIVDGVKPLGISAFQSLPGAMGVVADDLAVGVLVGLLLWVLAALHGRAR